MISKNPLNSRTISFRITSTRTWQNSSENSTPRKSTHYTELSTISRSTPWGSVLLLWWPAESSSNQPSKTTTKRRTRSDWRKSWQLRSQKSTRSVSPSWTDPVIMGKLFELNTYYLCIFIQVITMAIVLINRMSHHLVLSAALVSSPLEWFWSTHLHFIYASHLVCGTRGLWNLLSSHCKQNRKSLSLYRTSSLIFSCVCVSI